MDRQRFRLTSMELSSPYYNLEFAGENMDQKDRSPHCCTGEFQITNKSSSSFFVLKDRFVSA